MTERSDIVITVGGQDITDYVQYASAVFEQNANALPGNFSFRVNEKQADPLFEFQIGQEVYLELDGQRLFGGYLLIYRKVYPFAVVDTSIGDPRTLRQWELQGADFNILLDKRVLRNPGDYKRAIEVNGPLYDGALIRNHLENYIDLPSGFDITSEVDNVAQVGLKGKFAFPTQGSTWRQVMEDLRERSGATYFIDADKKLHWHAVARTKHAWGLTDRPGASGLIGCRDLQATQDGSQMVTDALVWTGNEIFANSQQYTPQGSGLFFNRFPDPPANSESVDGIQVWSADQEQRAIDLQGEWGMWQRAEQHFGEGNSPEKGALRARYMVLGPAGSIYGVEGGLGRPLWNITATWFGHDVPGGNHIPAGYLVDLILYVMGEDETHPLVQLLPLRHSSITFPTIPEDPTGMQTYVQFQGQFGIDYSDHRRLWRAMRRGRNRSVQEFGETSTSSIPSPFTDADVIAGDSEPAYGAYLKVSATIEADNDDLMTIANINLPYIAGTASVYLNGLYQRPYIEYSEDPLTGRITFYAELLPTDQVYVEARSAGSV